MAGLTGVLTRIVVAKLTSAGDGVNVRAGAIRLADPVLTELGAPTLGLRSVVALHASADISEKSGHAHYPALFVYCDKIANSMREKFRQFSGKAHLVVEVRYSQDKLDGLEANTQVFVDAVCGLLDDSRGDWGAGAFYGGGYEVSYEPIARGGKNFLQRAKVGFEVEVSK
jgi:hypothetical protein